MIGITLVLFYVILILPLQLGNRRRRRQVEALVPGAEVVTFGGLVGRVVQLGDEELLVEVSPGIQVRVMREAIRTVRAQKQDLTIEPSDEEGD